VLTTILERQARARDQVLHGPGDEDLRRFGVRCDAGADRDRETGALAVDHLAFAGVHAHTDLDVELADALDHLERARDRRA
jgi:hypothetical protein